LILTAHCAPRCQRCGKCRHCLPSRAAVCSGMSATDGWTQMRGPSPATARTCTHARTLARACTHKHTHAHICTCTCTRTRKHACTSMHPQTHARAHMHVHTCTLTRTHGRTRTCTHLHARTRPHSHAGTHTRHSVSSARTIRSVTQRWCVGESRLRIPTTDNDAVALAVHDIVIQPRACEALAARRRLQGKALGTSGYWACSG
jgi:hypothetical protein